MRKHLASFLALSAFAALCMATSKPKESTDSGSSSTTATAKTGATVAATTPAPPASSAAPSKPAKEDVPDPTADYKSVDDLKMDGDKSTGKTVLLRVRRSDLSTDSFTAFPCGTNPGFTMFKVTFEAKDKDLARAIPSSAFGAQCPRVHLKITGREWYSKDTYKAKALAILDVEVAEAKPLPKGVDYLSIDDASLAGDAAKGKILQIDAWRGSTNEKDFIAYPCKGALLDYVKVKYTDDQKEKVKGIATTARSCSTVKVKLTSREYYSKKWNAELLAIE